MIPSPSEYIVTVVPSAKTSRDTTVGNDSVGVGVACGVAASVGGAGGFACALLEASGASGAQLGRLANRLKPAMSAASRAKAQRRTMR